jgi:tRNA(Ile)-lysidine synthase
MKNSDNMWFTEFEKRFQEASGRCQLRLDAVYLVGVSGGADSVALAHWLHSQHFRIAIAHFHHGARTAADDDAAFVKTFAKDLGLPLQEGHTDVPAMAKEKGLSFEEAARIARYQFLFTTADAMNCGGVIVAHTADDQVETVLMHLLRGSGVAGLRGMQFRERMPLWHPSLPLLRPFLNQWREDVEHYCAMHGLAYVSDESNQDQTFFRNRLRHSLIPQLATYNAGVKGHIWQTADILKDSESIVAVAVDNAWQNVVNTEKEGLVILERDAFVASTPALQRYLLRRCMQHLLPDLRDLDYTMTRSIVDLMAEQKHEGCLPLFEDCLLMRYSNSLLLGREDVVYQHLWKNFPQWRQPERLLDMQSNGALDLDNGWTLSYAEYPMDDKLREASPWLLPNQEVAWFDVNQLVEPIVLRHAAEGDNFQPYGMHGRHMKLSDYFVNQKIPQMMREFFPLVCDCDDILWVVGQRRSEKGLIGPDTSHVIHFRLTHEE